MNGLFVQTKKKLDKAFMKNIPHKFSVMAILKMVRRKEKENFHSMKERVTRNLVQLEVKVLHKQIHISRERMGRKTEKLEAQMKLAHTLSHTHTYRHM